MPAGEPTIRTGERRVAVGVAAVSIIAYVVADAGDASESTSSTSDSVYWISLGWACSSSCWR